MITRREWLRWTAASAALAATTPMAHGIGPRSRFSVAQLQYEGGVWNPREQGTYKLLKEVEKRTSIEVDSTTQPVTAGDSGLFRHPFLLWTGDRGFKRFSDTEVERLGVFLRAGGLLFIDGCEDLARGEFDRSVRRELARILPDRPLAPLDWEHVLFKSFYLLRPDQPWGRQDLARDVEAIHQDDRLLVIYSKNDLQGAWARRNDGTYPYVVVPGGFQQREYSYRYGINLVMYALCMNYKADQVHIPFILKRRRR